MHIECQTYVHARLNVAVLFLVGEYRWVAEHVTCCPFADTVRLLILSTLVTVLIVVFTVVEEIFALIAVEL